MELELSWNLIDEVRKNDLRGLHSLEKLSLRGNHISSIDALSFRDLSSLKTLNLMGNKLEEWSSNITHAFRSSLEVLNLSDNLITQVTGTMFDRAMPRLRDLLLDVNAMNRIDDDAFASLQNLRVLSLNRNLLKSFSSSTFSGLHRLEELYLDFNFFSDFPELPSFASVQNSLRLLSFAGNQRLKSLPLLDFPNLESFNISFCNLDLIANFTFSGTPLLRVIDMSHNFIRFMASGSLNGLRHIQHLDLSWNAFVLVPYAAMSPISETLEELILDHNALHRISSSRFDNDGLLSHLKFLSLRGTLLSAIDSDSFFRNLRSLKSLKLSSSQLNAVPGDAITNLIELEDFDFSENFISK